MAMSVGFIPARIFLSTPSARRATRRHRPARRLQYDFYPRPPRGGRHWIKLKDSFMNSISIHALREEGDAVSGWATRLLLNFYPRPPRGGRRRPSGTPPAARSYFYPRPPRGGRPRHHHQPPARENFYPRPPRGGRRSAANPARAATSFLSTPSARRATMTRRWGCWATSTFLSTPSARRATRFRAAHIAERAEHFYPRPPRGGRPVAFFIFFHPFPISIHALREEGDSSGCTAFRGYARFLSTPSARRATGGQAAVFVRPLYFYPRPPRGGRHGQARRS